MIQETKTGDEIRTAVDALLAAGRIEFTAVCVGKDTKDEWEHFAWRVTFDKPNSPRFAVDYKTGLGRLNPATPAQLRQADAKYPEPRLPGTVYGREYPKYLNSMRTPKPPTATDVLASLCLDGQAIGQSFEDWCDDCGYNTDSRKALDIYMLCQTNAERLCAVLGGALMAQIVELVQDY